VSAINDLSPSLPPFSSAMLMASNEDCQLVITAKFNKQIIIATTKINWATHRLGQTRSHAVIQNKRQYFRRLQIYFCSTTTKEWSFFAKTFFYPSPQYGT
jgi:hypothetical protein